MNNRIKVMSLAGLMVVSNLSQSSPISDDYHTGDRLTATMLENIRDAVNDNDTRISALQTGSINIPVDCSTNPDAFRNTPIEDNVTYTLTGMCNGPIRIESHDNVTIQGDATGSKDDGVELQAGLTVQPYAAIGIWQSNGVILDNLTVSAANYVSETYSFGNNVSALHVGIKALAEASNVDFVGGDYSVHVYNDGMLTLREGNTVSGFNLGGLTAYNQGLIRTLDDITVSGLAGASTSEDSNAIQAADNAVIDIRGGGTFASPTVAGMQDYRTTIWATDNGTVKIRDASNPTQVTGGVASSRSAVVLIEGNATVNGYIAAYNTGYTQIAGTTQFGGQLESGDAGYLRFDNSSLTLSNPLEPTAPIDVYRMGKLRISNSALDLGGNDVSVYNFGMLNLRGSTDLGGADIVCHERRLIIIQGSVTNVGAIGC